MTESEVRAIMQEPQGEEQYAMDGSTFDVWFYITSPTVLGQIRLVTANLTPLTFKDGILIGSGSSTYRHLMNRCKVEQTSVSAPSDGGSGAGKGQTPPPPAEQQGPNWGPVSPQAQPHQPPSAPQKNPQSKPADQQKQGETSCSSPPSNHEQTVNGGNEKVPNKTGQQPAGQQPPDSKPLNEEEDRQLDEASEQQFNQS